LIHPTGFATRRRLLATVTLTLAAAGAPGLSGCATRSGGSEPDEKPPVVRSLMLLPIDASPALTVENRGMRGGMGMLGIFGALAAADKVNKNGARVGRALRKQGGDFAAHLHAAVMREMASAPVAFSAFSDTERAAKAREAEDYKLLAAEADAVLDIRISHIGFHSSSGFDDYTPLVDVSMDLRSPTTNQSLADASYSSYRAPSKGDPRHFQTSTEFQFANVDALVADSARATRALEVAIVAIAGGIAVDVRTVLAGKFL
jgi:hypothetical protein